jgi:hypothetical protein
MQYATATVTVYGRNFLCRVFKSAQEANAYMESNPDYAVLREWSGRIYLAHKSDMGKPA